MSLAPAALAAGAFFAAADVVFLGELHDNPGHHARQAEYVERIAPTALVFEMLTPDQAARVTPELLANPREMAEALDWADSGWPDFSMYHPIFVAGGEAAVFGAAVPRGVARDAMRSGVVESFSGDAGRFGLDRALPEAEQAAREAAQMAAHCDALPEDMLPGMVDIQRLRDAELARAALEAFEAHGGPVVVITGNGHARRDRGAPVYLAAAAPELEIAALGQGEEGAAAPAGDFDEIAFSPPAERDDPCEAFR
ncbi:ChaN family lipoprotein [Marivita sp. GX14005]|uniref:ChaN family lipoprotein n=1 Tax=Marivita sp. GX14005 TaxID=2942276 RepID=UPI0020188914|nr:ChaN family lipoprotein [Marivita sp. GX14005]MCL3881962.1 ChaN family lipoprotein [Marivita sp. GX14005]